MEGRKQSFPWKKLAKKSRNASNNFGPNALLRPESVQLQKTKRPQNPVQPGRLSMVGNFPVKFMDYNDYKSVSKRQSCTDMPNRCWFFHFFLTSWAAAHMLNYVKRPIRDIYTRNCVFFKERLSTLTGGRPKTHARLLVSEWHLQIWMCMFCCSCERPRKGGVRFAKGLNTTIYKPIENRKPGHNPMSRFCLGAKGSRKRGVRAV